jgi:hypothetical protein
MDFHTRMTPPDEDAGTEVIYPHLNPRGEPAQEPVPAPMPQLDGPSGELPVEPGQPDHIPPPPPPPPFTPQGRRDGIPPWTRQGQAWGAPALNAPLANTTQPLDQNVAPPNLTSGSPMTGNTPLAQPNGYPQAAWGAPPSVYSGTTR